MISDDLQFSSNRLPGRTFSKAIFDSTLIRLSDKGSASHLMGTGWSDHASGEMSTWIGERVPADRPDLTGGTVAEIHRLDTIPGVASRASKLGLKNPDFLMLIRYGSESVVVGVDAKFSIETARADQVSEEATDSLFEQDERLAQLLPRMNGDHSYARGLFVSPDYSLTHAMFRQRMGHRRMTVNRENVVLVPVDAEGFLTDIGNQMVMQVLIDLDALAFPVWSSLLAGQYYLRLSCAMNGLAVDERLPLFGQATVQVNEDDVVDRVRGRMPRSDSAWNLMRAWDRDVERIRRQRQAMQQVVGMPLSGAEYRNISAETLDNLEPERRPSRNRLRKALGARYTKDVLERTGVVWPSTKDFTSELERVAEESRVVAELYQRNIAEIMRELAQSLAAERAVTGAPHEG